MFYIPKEINIYCTECNITTYNYIYLEFLLIELDKEDKEILLNEKIISKGQQNKREKCSFCGGNITDCIVKEEFLDFPEILVVVIEGKYYHKFKLKNNIQISNNNKDIVYDLKCFIEANKNKVYFEKNNNWFKYNENNSLEKSKDYDKNNPVVLFYKLKTKKKR